VRIRTFAHAGLRRLYVADQTKGLPPDAVEKLRKMLAFLQDMAGVSELRALPAWKAHPWAVTGKTPGACTSRATGG